MIGRNDFTDRGGLPTLGSMNALAIVEPEEPHVALAGPVVLSAAELAECTCPDWCERDHDNE